MSITWTIPDDIVWTGEDVIRLYNVATGEFQTLNGTASAIWNLVASGIDTDGIVERLAGEYSNGDPLEHQIIRDDIHSFLREMSESKAVVAAGAGAPAGERGAGEPPT